MADELSPIPEIPNFADEQILQDKIGGIRGILQRTQQPRAHLKQPEDPEFPREQEQQVGPEETSQKTHVGISTWPDG
jgi:hypothetical protein